MFVAARYLTLFISIFQTKNKFTAGLSGYQPAEYRGPNTANM